MAKKLAVLIFGLILFCSNKSFSQTTYFDQAIGLRGDFGLAQAVSYKKFINESNAIEIIAGRGNTYLNIGGAFQKHLPISRDLDWYFGAGASALLYRGSIGYGIQGYLGIQYNFDGIPLSITIDWIPTLETRTFIPQGGNLGIRYILD